MNNGSPLVSLDDLRRESTLTIIGYMGMNDEEPEIAGMAFNVFYEKFSPAFMVVCNKVCSQYNNLYDGISEVIFNNALNNAYFKASQFVTKNIEVKAVDSDVKRWLYGIATTELYIELRKIKASSGLMVLDDILMLESEMEHEEALIGECYEKEILNEALATLTEKERGILLMCYQFSDDGKNLKSDVIERINNIFNIKDANRRQIKKRALEKLLQQINYIQSKN